MKKVKNKNKHKSPFMLHIITALTMLIIMTIQIVICAFCKDVGSLLISVAFNIVWAFVLGIFVSNHLRFLMEEKILDEIKENNPRFSLYKNTKGKFQEEEIEPFEFFKENIKQSENEEKEEK